MANEEIDLSDSANLGVLIEQLFSTMPDGKRKLMAEWAKREMETRPLVTRVSKRMWADAWTDKETGKAHPGEWQTVVWEVGQASPSNEQTRIFAMLLDDGIEGKGPVGKVAVFSFGRMPAKDDPEQSLPVYFKELVYSPDVIYGQATGEAIYREFFDFFATEEEREEAARMMEEAEEKAHANGAAS